MQMMAVTPATPRTDPVIAPSDKLLRFNPGAPLKSVTVTKGAILPDNHHCQNTKSDTEIYWNRNHSVSQGILSHQY